MKETAALKLCILDPNFSKQELPVNASEREITHPVERSIKKWPRTGLR
jgi:hypothetical protein